VAAWGRNTLKNISFFMIFWKKDPSRENLPNSFTKEFNATQIDLCWNSWNLADCALLTWQKNKTSPGSSALAAAQIAPKICQGHSQIMCSECSRFHPNRFTFGEVISERVNTVRARSKVNPIFDWSLASSLITNKYDLNMIKNKQMFVENRILELKIKLEFL